MIVSTNDRTEDNGSVNVTSGVVIVVIILKARKNRWVFYFVETFVILGDQPLLKENDGILMAIANEALLFLTQFPLV